MKEAKLPFKEIIIPLRQPDTRARILEVGSGYGFGLCHLRKLGLIRPMLS